MCRNIKILYNFQPPTTEDEVHAAAEQYVRKVSGMQKPSKANEAVFEQAIDAVASATKRLLDQLVTTAPPRTWPTGRSYASSRTGARLFPVSSSITRAGGSSPLRSRR